MVDCVTSARYYVHVQ